MEHISKACKRKQKESRNYFPDKRNFIEATQQIKRRSKIFRDSINTFSCIYENLSFFPPTIETNRTEVFFMFSLKLLYPGKKRENLKKA